LKRSSEQSAYITVHDVYNISHLYSRPSYHLSYSPSFILLFPTIILQSLDFSRDLSLSLTFSLFLNPPALGLPNSGVSRYPSFILPYSTFLSNIYILIRPYSFLSFPKYLYISYHILLLIQILQHTLRDHQRQCLPKGEPNNETSQ
jgi:hypothetical protein